LREENPQINVCLVPCDDLLKKGRYAEIFKELVDAYVDTGEPVGSNTLAMRIEQSLSPATIRNVVSELEDLGFVQSLHASSGRTPTEKGWRFFVNSLIECRGNGPCCRLSASEKRKISSLSKKSKSLNIESILEKTTSVLSELSKCASIVFLPTKNSPIKYVDFLLLSPGRAIVILVTTDGVVENRLIDVPVGVSNSVLERVGNYLNTKLSGKTLPEINNSIQIESEMCRDGIDEIVKNIASSGIEILNSDDFGEKVIVRGHSNLVDKLDEIENLNKLLKILDEKETMKSILDSSINGKGMQVFIGAESKLFNLSGCSMIAAPYESSDGKIIGAIGVVGPSRMRYSRVITIVDYIAQMLGSLV
jgi:heat-inducible transcriptional repressor